MIQQDTQPLRAALERLATEAERMAAVVDGASVSFHMGRRDAFRDAARLAASWEDAALAAAPVAWCEACGFAHAAGWPDCIDAAPVAEGQKRGVDDLMARLYKDGGAEPMRTWMDYDEVRAALLALAPPSPPATVAEGQERCVFQCDGDAGHEGPHFFWYDGPHPIGPLPEAPPSPPAGIDVERLARALDRVLVKPANPGTNTLIADELAADLAAAYAADAAPGEPAE